MLAPILISLGITALVFLCVPLGLIFSQAPREQRPAAGTGIDFASAVDADYSTMPPTIAYTARDGSDLAYRRYDGGTERLIVLVHGSGWHGMQFHPMASALAARGLGTVIVPDLRGHGAHPQRRGDIDHIGQLEDDLAEIITTLRGETSFGETVLGGHSSGGGLVVRFAGGAHGALADRFLLLAPFLKYDAPTTRPNSGDWAYPATRRIVGLTILNGIGVTALNGLRVISFAMPAAVTDGPLGSTATTQYSYRLNTGFAPRARYGRDLARMDRPFLLLAGDADESFIAEAYQPVISAHTPTGRYRVLDGVNHIGVTTDHTAIDAVAAWIDAPGAR